MVSSNLFGGDGVSVSVTADTSSFKRKMQAATSRLESLGDEATQTAGSLGVFSGAAEAADGQASDLSVSMAMLGSRTDEAGDEIDQAGRSALTTAPTFTSLSLSTEGLSMAMTTLSSSMIPVMASLATLSTMLAPLAAAAGMFALSVGSLGAAFGGLMLAGAVNYMDQLKQALSRATDAIQGLLVPLSDVFGPLLVQAVESLPYLVQEMLAAVGSVSEFRKTLVRLGKIAFRVIPQLTGFVFSFARKALPVFNQFVTYLLNKGPKAFRAMQNATNRIMPVLKNLLSAAVSLAPTFLKFGTVVATNILPMLTSLLQGVRSVMTGILGLDKNVRDFTTTMLALVGPLYLIAGALGGPVTLAIAGVVAAVAGLQDAWKRNTLGIQQLTSQLATQTSSTFASLSNTLQRTTRQMLSSIRREWTQAQGEIGQNLARIQADNSKTLGKLRQLWDTFMSGLQSAIIQPALSGISRLWDQHGSRIMSSVTQLTAFLTRAFRGFVNVAHGLWQNFGDELVAITRFFADTIGSVLGAFADTAITTFDVLTDLLVGDFDSALSKLGGLVRRILGGILDYIGKWASGFADAAIQAGQDAANGLIDAFNSLLPDSFSIPEITIGGGSLNIPSVTIGGGSFMGQNIPSATIGGGQLGIPSASVGGQSLSIPKLDTGGFIEDAGLAMLHAGEQVVPAAEVDRGRSGGGGTNITIEKIEASGRREGREAGKALKQELRSHNF